MSLVATLIANPGVPVLSEEVAMRAVAAVDAGTVVWLAPGVACDVDIPASADRAGTGQDLRKAVAGLPVDVVIQEREGRRKALLIADMDSTMIDQECIDELAAEAGLRDHVSAITARAMNGEIEFEPALRERVALLKGLPVSIIGSVLDNRITLAAGGRQLLATMRADGAYTALVSGGFTAFTGRVAAMLGFDEHRANRLDERDGVLTGTVAEPILGRDAKMDSLRDIATQRGIGIEDAIAVGDGANDLGMLGLAGSGVALHAKPAVAARAPMRIDHGDLTALLYIQGYRREEFVQ